MNTTDKKHTDATQPAELAQDALDQVHGGADHEDQIDFKVKSVIKKGGIADINKPGYTDDSDLWS